MNSSTVNFALNANSPLASTESEMGNPQISPPVSFATTLNEQDRVASDFFNLASHVEESEETHSGFACIHAIPDPAVVSHLNLNHNVRGAEDGTSESGSSAENADPLLNKYGLDGRDKPDNDGVKTKRSALEVSTANAIADSGQHVEVSGEDLINIPKAATPTSEQPVEPVDELATTEVTTTVDHESKQLDIDSAQDPVDGELIATSSNQDAENRQSQNRHHQRDTNPGIPDSIVSSAPTYNEDALIDSTGDSAPKDPSVNTSITMVPPEQNQLYSPERISLTRLSATTSLVASEAAATQLDQAFRTKFTSFSDESKQTISLNLHPAELGQLQVTVEQFSDQIVAQIVATEFSSTELLLQEKDFLLQTLSELGFGEAFLDIAHGGSKQDQFSGEQQEYAPTGYETETHSNETMSIVNIATDGVNIVA